jgi:hypothetical protein
MTKPEFPPALYLSSYQNRNCITKDGMAALRDREASVKVECPHYWVFLKKRPKNRMTASFCTAVAHFNRSTSHTGRLPTMWQEPQWTRYQ